MEPETMTESETERLREGGPPQYAVALRLVDGGRVEAGAFADEEEAHRYAAELISTLAGTGEKWPLVGDRYLRPQAVVSIDLIREAHPRWTGSTGRATPWSGRQAEPEGEDAS
ncbi:MAG: hypothetical protein ABR583_04810 [Gaiellaceae bacterium]